MTRKVLVEITAEVNDPAVTLDSDIIDEIMTTLDEAHFEDTVVWVTEIRLTGKDKA
jgi:hypothetical protein